MLYFVQKKTKLLLYADKTFSAPLNPIVINNEAIKFSDEADHVGVVRSTKGNLPNILNRIHPCKQSIRVLNMYGLPVPMSCLGSLLLTSKEVDLIHQHHKTLLQQLQKLHNGTPCIYFLHGRESPSHCCPPHMPVLYLWNDLQTTRL